MLAAEELASLIIRASLRKGFLSQIVHEIDPPIKMILKIENRFLKFGVVNQCSSSITTPLKILLYANVAHNWIPQYNKILSCRLKIFK